MDSTQASINSLVEAITEKHETVNLLSKCFRDGVDGSCHQADALYSAEYWRCNTYGNALVRLRIILEQNFKMIETLGLVAATRYIFELSLWLKLFEIDVNYALVYRKRLIHAQKEFYTDTLNHHKNEINLLKALEVEDKINMDETKNKLMSSPNISPEEIEAIILNGRNEVDDKAARQFSIYTDQAKKNGYAFQAYHIETKVIPKLQKTVEELSEEYRIFNVNTSGLLNGLLQCARWNEMAKKANMLSEFEYIYSYTSKLLHCTPESVTTDQKCLEPEEMVIFLRYIHTKIRDIIDLAHMQPEFQ